MSVDAGPAEFVERFQDAWRQSSADALLEVLTDDVVLRQPSMPDVVGRAAAHEAFTRLFRAIPDLTATVHRWSAQGDVVFIEFTLSGEFGGRPLSWPAVDRFIVRDGLGCGAGQLLRRRQALRRNDQAPTRLAPARRLGTSAEAVMSDTSQRRRDAARAAAAARRCRRSASSSSRCRSSRRCRRRYGDIVTIGTLFDSAVRDGVRPRAT